MKAMATLVSVLCALGLVAATVEAGCGACGPAAKVKSCGAACAKACCAAKAAKTVVEKPDAAAEISTSTLKALIASKAEVHVLDARSGKWDDGKRIPGAKSLAAGVDKEKVSELLPSKDALVVTYCSNLKCGASRKLAKHLRSLGYENVLEYPEGIAGWIDAGQDVVKADK